MSLLLSHINFTVGLGSSPGLCLAFQAFLCLRHLPYQQILSKLPQPSKTEHGELDRSCINSTQIPLTSANHTATRDVEKYDSFYIWKDILVNSHNINHVSQLDFQNCWPIHFLFTNTNCNQVTLLI